MAEGKWLTGLTPDQDAVEAGQQILENRFGMLIRSVEKLEAEDPGEAIHQLRVGTRRAEAAVRLLQPCLRPKIYRATRALLRSMRQAAGDVRDTDVLLTQVQQQLANADAKEQPGLELFLGHLLGQRVESEANLLRLPPEQMEAALERALAGLRAADPETFGPLARAALRKAVRRFNKTLQADTEDEANLHRTRIAGKRLRYVVELTGPCLDSTLVEEMYPRLEALQEMLGRVNDSHNALDRLIPFYQALPLLGEQAAAHYRPGLEELHAEHVQRLKVEREAFESWLAAWQEAAVPAFA